ncbi:MAG: SusC/RagA family TonB-linked outer membrane protein [Ferruginibacter sp.]
MRKFFILMGAFFLWNAPSLFAQGTVSGKVTDTKGDPLPGISVKVKGAPKGTITTIDGSFTLNIKQAQVTLEFTGTDITPVSQNAKAGETVSVALEQKTKSLNEVVITAVGIKRAEKSLGYSLSRVDPKTIVQKSEPDVLKTLAGKVAGVDIRTSNGTPGAATRIQIRGNSSFFGETQPLIIVDGTPFSNDEVATSDQNSGGGAYSSGISNLDPNDIASMTVLKGSAASALYGSRASNGVLVITTKSGNPGRSKKGMEVAYSTSAGIENVNNLPVYQNEYGPGKQFTYANANGSWGPKFGTIDSIPTWPAYLAAFPNLFGANYPYRAVPGNVKSLFRTGSVYENSLSFSGGNEKTSMAATVSLLNHDGYVPNSSFDRANISFGGATKLDNGLNIRGNYSYSKSKQIGGVFGEQQSPGASSSFARSLFLARNWDFSFPFEDALGNPVSTIPAAYDNPLWDYIHNTVTTEEERTIAGLHLDYTINKWLRLDYQIGSNVNSLYRKEIFDIGSRAASGKGQLIENNYYHQEIESNFLITLSPKILDDFTFKTVIGHNVNARKIRNQVNAGNEFISPGIYNLTNTSKQTFGADVLTKHNLYGVFGDIELGYKNFAFLTATGRNDWSSTLPISNRSYFYPSLSGSLIVSDALHISSNVVDLVKLRGGWAKVGRDADPYFLEDTYILNQNFLGQSTATSPTTSTNPKLKPEFTRELELGTQLSFFKRRVGLDFTWYNKISDMLISTVTTPASTGYTGLIDNFGKIRNRGVEIDFSIVPLRTKDFSWDIHAIFTKNTNLVLSLVKGLDRLPLSNAGSNEIGAYLEAGKPFGYLRGTVNARDSLGNLLIDPGTGFLIRSTEQRQIGDPNPDFKLGLTNTFNYKGITLSVLFDYTKGGDIYSVTVESLLARGVTQDTKDRETSWIIPGYYGDINTGLALLNSKGAEINNITRISTNDLYFGESFASNSAKEWNVFDATVYHLREISLGYEIPKSWFKKIPLGSMSVSLTGRNLWHYAPNLPKYTNFDPEVNSFGSSNSQGIEQSAAPTSKRYSINLRVTL